MPFRADFVLMSTALPYSGLPVPSMMPGISLNCRLTSSTISAAAFPTALIACDEKKNGIIAPMKPATNMAGSAMSTVNVDTEVGRNL